MQPVLFGRPDSDAHLLLTDDSLSQPNEPDPMVKAEDESSSKLVLISVHINTRNTGGQELFLPTSITLGEGRGPPTACHR